MKKLLSIFSVVTLGFLYSSVHAADYSYKAPTIDERISKFEEKSRTAAETITKSPVPDTLPDIAHLGITWEQWRKARIVNFFENAIGYNPTSTDPDTLARDREMQIVFGILVPHEPEDPFMNTRPAQPTKKYDEHRHGWNALRAIMSFKVADGLLDWILPDFEKAFAAVPPETQLNYRMAVKSAITYLKTADFKAESEYLKKLKDGSLGFGLEESTFCEYKADGSEREFGKVEAFLYRRFADSSFKQDEMLALVTKIDAAMVK